MKKSILFLMFLHASLSFAQTHLVGFKTSRNLVFNESSSPNYSIGGMYEFIKKNNYSFSGEILYNQNRFNGINYQTKFSTDFQRNITYSYFTWNKIYSLKTL